MQDALGGQVQLAIGSEFLVKPHIDSGSVIPLVITTAKRAPGLPNVPTVAESGFPGFSAPAWWAVLAPGKTPPAIVDAMNVVYGRGGIPVGMVREGKTPEAAPMLSVPLG